MGVYCRRWGIPLIDAGTVRLPRLVGEGRAMDLILTGRRVDADEALRIGLCEYVVPEGEARTRAESLAHDLCRYPQACMRADRRSARAQHGLAERDALRQEWWNSKAEVVRASRARRDSRAARGEAEILGTCDPSLEPRYDRHSPHRRAGKCQLPGQTVR